MIDSLLQCIGFAWDAHNSNKITGKHGVTTVECEQVLFNVPVIVGDDIKHSETEARSYVLGQTNSGRLLFLVFTIRKDKIRVVSARDMNKKERKVCESYEEENPSV
ncbi:MAG TPA: BrnT family toxin [Syntrophorhabdaceae bacterium]|nr:BrnT family toxin [Syntrophorhabdaceae bacterium]HQM80799.1 BrnT family toxin [Syntrophorhabdaceae bacterium]